MFTYSYKEHLKASFGSQGGQALGIRFPTGKSMRHLIPPHAGGGRPTSTSGCLETPWTGKSPRHDYPFIKSKYATV
jgi:hypothetical protein